jgi:hypothetical protein
MKTALQKLLDLQERSQKQLENVLGRPKKPMNLSLIAEDLANMASYCPEGLAGLNLVVSRGDYGLRENVTESDFEIWRELIPDITEKEILAARKRSRHSLTFDGVDTISGGPLAIQKLKELCKVTSQE